MHQVKESQVLACNPANPDTTPNGDGDGIVDLPFGHVFVLGQEFSNGHLIMGVDDPRPGQCIGIFENCGTKLDVGKVGCEVQRGRGGGFWCSFGLVAFAVKRGFQSTAVVPGGVEKAKVHDIVCMLDGCGRLEEVWTEEEEAINGRIGVHSICIMFG